jgi:hydrogenase maturation protease
MGEMWVNMKKSVIAIGNRLMMDDAIGISVIESIKRVLELKDIEVIIGETDIDYCFSKLNLKDEFYIVDSTCYGNIPGTVIVKTLEDAKKFRAENYSIHALNLINLISLYKLDIKGYFIGIEIENIEINIGLSIVLKEQFQVISNKVLSIII